MALTVKRFMRYFAIIRKKLLRNKKDQKSKEIAIYSKQLAKKIIALSATHSTRNYKLFLDIINDDEASVENKEVSEAVNTFLNEYFCKSSVIFYASAYRTGTGDKNLYKPAYDKLYPFVLRNFNLNSFSNKYKAMTLLSYLIINYHDRIFKDIDKALLRTTMDELSIVDHRKIFQIFRKHMSPKEVFDNFFDITKGEASVQYLFCLYLLTVSLNNVDRDASLQFIRSRLPLARDKNPGDDVRRSILQKYTSGDISIRNQGDIKYLKNVKLPKKRKIAFLVSGQLRNCTFASLFPEKYLRGNYDVDVFVSTWNVRGGPPPFLTSLRGYTPGIRILIQKAAIKYNISAKEFSEVYHRSVDEVVTDDQVNKSFNPDWSEIDVEGVSTPLFDSNQSRMHFKLERVFSAARNVGEYECFVRMRPDLSFGFSKQQIVDAIESCFSLPKIVYLRQFVMMYDSHMPMVDDNFAVASPQAMEVYASLWARKQSNLPSLPLREGGTEIVPHSSLAYWLMMNSVQIEFLTPVSKWKFNGTALIDARTFIEHLNQLVGNRGINEAFVRELVSDLSAKLEASNAAVKS